MRDHKIPTFDFNCFQMLQRVTIIGNYLSFRKLLFDAVNEKLEERIPFLHNPVTSLHNFHDDFTLEDQELLNEMSSAIGLHIVQEPMLTQHIKELPQTDVDDDYTVACLLMTFIAVAIPELAMSENSRFNVIISIISMKKILFGYIFVRNHFNEKPTRYFS